MSLKTILAAKGDHIISIQPTADLAAAAKLLSTHRIGALVVLDAGGRLVDAARAQQPGKLYWVGLLGGGMPPGPLDERQNAFISGLAERGFVNGRNLVFEGLWGEGHNEGLAD